MSYRAHDCASAACLSAFGEALTGQLGWCHGVLCIQFVSVADPLLAMESPLQGIVDAVLDAHNCP